MVTTLNAKLDLPGPFSYFSLTNWFGNPDGSENFFLHEDYITEQNLFYKIKKAPLQAVVQYFSISGDENDILRFGAETEVNEISFLRKIFKKLNTKYKVTYFPWQLDHYDGYGFQIQYVLYSKIMPKTFNERMYLYGFADQNIMVDGEDKHNKLVSELQLGYRIYKGFHLVSELRCNGFFPKGSRFGVGLGMEYKYSF